MATTDKTAEVDGLISLGYEREDYAGPIPAEGESRPTKTIFPTFRVCDKAAVELHKALNAGKLLNGEFAAIVVLKSSMVRISDNDEDVDPSQDIELEFVVKAILPHIEDSPGGEAEILADFDKLPAAVKETPGADDDEEEND